jgi:hypothetical protein
VGEGVQHSGNRRELTLHFIEPDISRSTVCTHEGQGTNFCVQTCLPEKISERGMEGEGEGEGGGGGGYDKNVGKKKNDYT